MITKSNFSLAYFKFLKVEEEFEIVEFFGFSALHLSLTDQPLLSSQLHGSSLMLRGCVALNQELRQSLLSGHLPVQMNEMTIFMLDGEGQRLAGYDVTALTVLSAEAGTDGSMDICLAVSHYETDLMHVNVLQSIWCNGIQEKNLWAGLDYLQRRSWLHLVRKHHCLCQTAMEDKPAHMVYEMDGRFITDYPSFFIALGEAINGPGAYFGGGFDALADCLCGDFGAKTPFSLVWTASDIARVALDKNKSLEEVLASREDALRNHDFEEDEFASVAEIMRNNTSPLFDNVIDNLGRLHAIRLMLT